MARARAPRSRKNAGSAPEAPAGDEELTDTQRRILTAALEVFSDEGYSGASTARIAARAGVAEKTIFALFKSKSELLARTLRPSVFLLAEPRVFERVNEAMASEGRTAEQVLAALMRDRLELASKHKKKLKLIAHEALLRPDILSPFPDAFRARVAPLVARAAMDLASRGELRTDVPPKTLVRTVVSIVVGYALSKHVLGLEPDADDEEEIAAIARLLADGLRPREAAKARPTGEAGPAAKARRR